MAREPEASALPAPYPQRKPERNRVRDDLITELKAIGRADLADLLLDIDRAASKFRATLDSLDNLGPETGLAEAANAMIQLDLEIGEAHDRAGLKPGRTAAERRIRRLGKAAFKREVDANETRAIATAAAMDLRIRLPGSLHTDSPKQAAMRTAAWFLGIRSKAPEEAVSQSINRLRKKWRGQYLFHFDPDSLHVSVHRAEDVIPGMRLGLQGRPKKLS